MKEFALWSLAVLAAAPLILAAEPPAPTNAAPGLTAEQKALKEQGDALLKKVGFTPGREMANRLSDPQLLEFWKKVAEGEPMDAGYTNWMWSNVRSAIDRGEAGITWPVPEEVKVPHADAMVVDGKLDEPSWQKATTYEGVYLFNTQNFSKEPATTWKLLWDDQYLYVGYVCADTNMIAEKRERDGDVYFDDCVEIFLLPDLRYRTYWELVVSVNGSVFDSVQCKNVDLWGMNYDKSQNIEGLKVGIDIRGELNKPGKPGDGYSVELAIPFNQVPGYTRAPARAGDTLRFMLVRLDKNEKSLAAYAFKPLLGWGHNVWNHAPMRLVK